VITVNGKTYATMPDTYLAMKAERKANLTDDEKRRRSGELAIKHRDEANLEWLEPNEVDHMRAIRNEVQENVRQF
jgi:hypothetical protein